MSIPNYIAKTIRLKPEVTKIFDDLEEWLDYCRFNLIKYDPRDLYRSPEYRAFKGGRNYKSKHGNKPHWNNRR